MTVDITHYHWITSAKECFLARPLQSQGYVNLTLKIISAVSQATVPFLSFEIVGVVDLLAAVMQRLATPQIRRSSFDRQ